MNDWNLVNRRNLMNNNQQKMNISVASRISSITSRFSVSFISRLTFLALPVTPDVSRFTRYASCLTALLFLGSMSCTSVQQPDQDFNSTIPSISSAPSIVKPGHSHESTLVPEQTDVIALPPLSVEDRMIFNNVGETESSSKSVGPLYRFRAQGMSLVDAIALFARTNKLNIVTGPDIEGEITVAFHDLPLERAMAALLDAHGYYWVTDHELIHVRRLETRVFNLDYIRLVRGGAGINKAQLASGTGNSSGTGSQDGGEVTVNQEVQIKFWEELEEQIKSIMSKEGSMVLNRLSGTIQITDRRQRMKEIANFLAKVRRSLYRQVEIQVRIYEVNLSDDYSLGIDWTKINFDGSAGNIAFSNIITAPFGGFAAKAATAAISFNDGSFDGVLNALREQGELKVVSQPRVMTLNNQPALIKVATDQSFFTQTVAQGAAGTGNIITEQVRSVTIGLVLSVTPQISEDGWIMLDVTPIISRLRRIIESPQKTATAPVLDVKQSSGLVRIKDGEMVLIGGLIQDEESETERKVPILGDLPWIGRLFKGTYTARQKSELVIFLSPHIVEPNS